MRIRTRDNGSPARLEDGSRIVLEIVVSPGNLILEMSMPGAAIDLLEPWS